MDRVKEDANKHCSKSLSTVNSNPDCEKWRLFLNCLLDKSTAALDCNANTLETMFPVQDFKPDQCVNVIRAKPKSQSCDSNFIMKTVATDGTCNNQFNDLISKKDCKSLNSLTACFSKTSITCTARQLLDNLREKHKLLLNICLQPPPLPLTCGAAVKQALNVACKEKYDTFLTSKTCPNWFAVLNCLKESIKTHRVCDKISDKLIAGWIGLKAFQSGQCDQPKPTICNYKTLFDEIKLFCGTQFSGIHDCSSYGEFEKCTQTSFSEDVKQVCSAYDKMKLIFQNGTRFNAKQCAREQCDENKLNKTLDFNCKTFFTALKITQNCGNWNSLMHCLLPLNKDCTKNVIKNVLISMDEKIKNFISNQRQCLPEPPKPGCDSEQIYKQCKTELTSPITDQNVCTVLLGLKTCTEKNVPCPRNIMIKELWKILMKEAPEIYTRENIELCNEQLRPQQQT
ncbi:uncharacterized protein LOC141914975 [Tubulanus polymorphus]|uniref:uncharacterized protein LOC141914975 n=1 Tax=Tubulanus polymorphus TaxID=672921 RepID=UPI003DA43D71